MAFVTEDFQAFLSAPLGADEVYLPLASSAYADLLKLLSENGSYTYLTIKDDTHMETVKAYAQGGYILLDRAQEGTTAVKFSYGACVTTISPTIIAAIKDLFCNYSCCGGGTCDCTNVYLAASDLPDGNVGVAWEGSITMGGTVPIDASVSAPAWMTVVQERNMLRLSGTPTTAGSLSLQVRANNCNASAHMTETLQLVIKA